jgi:hypothetical protein
MRVSVVREAQERHHTEGNREPWIWHLNSIILGLDAQKQAYVKAVAGSMVL